MGRDQQRSRIQTSQHERHGMKNILNKKLALLPCVALSLFTASSWSETVDQAWLVRARAVELNWANQQNNGLDATQVTAQKQRFQKLISLTSYKRISLLNCLSLIHKL